MQSVNVLATITSQDVDFKDKVSAGSLGESNDDSSFSRLVKQHVSEDRDGGDNTSSQKKSELDAAKPSNTHTKNGNNTTDTETARQENDSESYETSTVSNKANDENQASKKDIDTVDVHKELAEEGYTDKATDNEALAESEQFMSLLYKSDHTLSTATEPTKHSDNTSQSIAHSSGEKSSTTAANKKEVSLTSLEQIAVEHKLKSFSKDEQPSHTAKNNNVVSNVHNELLKQQSNEQLLKDYKLALQSGQKVTNTSSIDSEELMSAQLANADLKNNKITELAAGVSQATNAKLVDASTADIEQLSINSLKENATSEGAAHLTKDSVNKAQESRVVNKDVTLAKADKSAKVLNSLLTEDIDISEKNKLVTEPLTESIKADVIASQSNQKPETVNNVKATTTDSVTELANKGKLDKLMAERNAQPAIDSENIIKEQPLETQVKQATMSRAQILAAQALQQAQDKPQQKSQQMASEQLAVEASPEEYVDLSHLVEDKPVEPGVKTAANVMNNNSVRSTADIQSQTMQSIQTQQSNDDYMEHQSSEILSHNIASDTAHIQKNNVQLQQETISIFRKDFTDAVKDKVMVMINQKLQQFDISLDPPEFGNMQVRVNLQGEQAAVNFVVQNQQAKEALEQNMHKLKEMLAEQGVDVGGANVEQQSQQQNQDENGLDQNSDNSQMLSKQNQDEDNVEHILSADLFGTSATGVDYYA